MQHDPGCLHRILQNRGSFQRRRHVGTAAIGVAHNTDHIINFRARFHGGLLGECFGLPAPQNDPDQNDEGGISQVVNGPVLFHGNQMKLSASLRQCQFLLIGLLVPFAGAKAEERVETELETFDIETVADGLVNPWAMTKLPDGRLLITEKPGRLRMVTAEGVLLEEPIKGLPEIAVVGQGGLLDIELHPNYDENGWIYISYSGAENDGALTEIMRARLDGNALVDQETIFKPDADEYSKGAVHFGNRLAFDKENYLFFTIGERGGMKNAQDLTNVKGKTHRLHDDGRVPKDNPFVDEAGAEPSIWSYGHRNQQGLDFEPSTGRLWATEHGPKGGDELNLVEKGHNYGWPVITYGINYNNTPITDKREAEGMDQPVLQWTPSIAVCGIDFYRGDKFPHWEGDLLVTSLAHQKFIRLALKNRKVWTEEILFAGKGRLRDVYVSPEGEVFVIFDKPGKVVKLVPVAS